MQERESDYEKQVVNGKNREIPFGKGEVRGVQTPLRSCVEPGPAPNTPLVVNSLITIKIETFHTFNGGLKALDVG